jgi:hypothetical protein
MSENVQNAPHIDHAEAPQSTELTAQLQKEGFQADEIATVEKLTQEKPEKAAQIKADLQAIQGNPTEKNRFETLYIKPPVLTNGENSAEEARFAQIEAMPDGDAKNKILEGMTRLEKIRYKEW